VSSFLSRVFTAAGLRSPRPSSSHDLCDAEAPKGTGGMVPAPAAAAPPAGPNGAWPRNEARTRPASNRCHLYIYCIYITYIIYYIYTRTKRGLAVCPSAHIVHSRAACPLDMPGAAFLHVQLNQCPHMCCRAVSAVCLLRPSQLVPTKRGCSRSLRAAAGIASSSKSNLSKARN